MRNAALIARLLRQHAPDILFAAIMLLIMFFMGMYTALLSVVQGSTLMDGSSINGIDVSRMDPDQAVDYVVGIEEERLLGGIELTLSAQGREMRCDAGDLGATTDARELVSLLIGGTAEGSLMGRAEAYYALRDGAQCEITVAFDSDRVNAICRDFSELFYRAPVDASLRLSDAGDAFDYVPDQDGARVDRTALYQEVWEKLHEQRQVRVAVDVLSVSADVPLKALTDNTMLLAFYETRVDVEHAEAVEALAARLNGSAMQGSDSLDLRAVLYGEEGLVPGEEAYAASQIAGTLYDALLLAGADKVERHPNDRPPDYVEIGLDAALDGERNLIMQNNTRFPMYILAGVNGGTLRVEVHGRLMRVDETIQLRTGSIRAIMPDPPLFIDDSSLPEGELRLVTEAENGYRVSAYREVLVDDKVTSNELLSMDIYPAVQEVYHRGTGR